MKNDLEIIKRYEKVRKTGKYNMILEAPYAAEEAGLTIQEYNYVIKNYKTLMTKLDDAIDNGLA